MVSSPMARYPRSRHGIGGSECDVGGGHGGSKQRGRGGAARDDHACCGNDHDREAPGRAITTCRLQRRDCPGRTVLLQLQRLL